ncbi:MAG: hypothetical protein LBK72_09195 [Bifidobacteriaceae bacterium]|nr:hypothetical protein [Bifidobacteriaceae bacterium]
MGGVIVLGVAGGCSEAARPEVASLSGGATPTQASRVAALEALVACLGDAGIPALIGQVDDGDAYLGFADGHDVVGGYADGMGCIFGDPDEPLQDGFDDVVAGADFLFTDGTDHSETWRGCVASRYGPGGGPGELAPSTG